MKEDSGHALKKPLFIEHKDDKKVVQRRVELPRRGPGDDLKDREALRCPRRMGIVLTSRDGAMGSPQNRRVKSHSLTDSFKLLIDVS